MPPMARGKTQKKHSKAKPGKPKAKPAKNRAKTKAKPAKPAKPAKTKAKPVKASAKPVKASAKPVKATAAAPAKPTIASGARNAELEGAIRSSRHDGGAYDVYADWLQARGDALGELIALQRALERKSDPRKQRRADEIIAGLGLPNEKLATFGWRWGLWQWLRLETKANWTNEKFDAIAFAGPLFAMPACAALEELRIGILRWDFNHVDVPAVLAEASKHAWARDLRRLTLGTVDDEIDMAYHVIGRVGAAISTVFPRLESLKLHSGDHSWLAENTFVIGALDLPELAELVLETDSMSKARLADVLAARTPKLERLQLWFGSADEGADSELADLQPLLEGRVFPKLRHLGLCNTAFEDELARTIHAAPIAAQLESLDLSKGTMNDEAAVELARYAARFPKLKTLSVAENFLTRSGIAALAKAFGKVQLDATEQRSSSSSGSRYDAVRE